MTNRLEAESKTEAERRFVLKAVKKGGFLIGHDQMTKRKPDRREQKRIDKHNLEEESRRAKVILEISYGRSLREAGAAVGRSHEYARYWRDKGMEIIGYRDPDNSKTAVYAPVKGWREMIKVRRPGPPEGRSVKSHLFRDKAIELKTKFPMLGCVKLAIIGKLDISGPTLCGILKSEGMIEPQKKGHKCKRFRAEAPNDMWQIDYVDLGHGQHLLSVMDDCAGKILSDNVRETAHTDDVLEILSDCFGRYGRPKAVLSDHGTQWYATHGGDSRFDEMCAGNGIDHLMGRIAHPQTQGKVERWHRSLKEESAVRTLTDPDEIKKALAEYVVFYNTVRPHWGIDLKTPDSVYFSRTPG